jgi:hypothetical protein
MDKQRSKRAWIIALIAAPVVAVGLGRFITPEHTDAFLIGGLALIVVILVLALTAMLRERRKGG